MAPWRPGALSELWWSATGFDLITRRTSRAIQAGAPVAGFVRRASFSDVVGSTRSSGARRYAITLKLSQYELDGSGRG